ncbi:sigma-70 family RNA polymerase sigma factor [Promicromonospora sp. NPDC023987]|uniref:RNA polymerase sigma factor n=1 Tax=Promicromonospora sp. NPDC023987 TaxID=3155360 RepID=UPI0033F3050E
MTTTRGLSDGDPPSDEDRISELWRSYAWRVQAYALRHVDPHDAQEVVSETFLVAWRRLAGIPGDPLPWLLVVARNVVRNQRRAARRRSAAEERLLRLERVARATDDPVLTVSRRDAITALLRLAPKDREALLLTGWDGLTPAEAAQVAGCSVAAFKMRLSRARRRLESESALLPDSTSSDKGGAPEPGWAVNAHAPRTTDTVTDRAARRAR